MGNSWRYLNHKMEQQNGLIIFFLSVLLADIKCRKNKKIQCSQQQLQRRYSNRVEMHDKKIALE